MKMSASESQLQIRYVTKQEQYAVPDVPLSVPSTIETTELNTLINTLIKESRKKFKKIDFDFLVSGEFLRVSLAEHLQERGISTENVVDVEYLEKHPSPEPQDSLLHDDWVSSVHMHSDWLLSGCYDNSVNVWTNQGRHVLKVGGHTSHVKSVKWVQVNPERAVFVSASHDQTCVLWVWDIVRNQCEAKWVCRGHERGLDCVAVSPDKTKMATGSWDTMMKLWSASIDNVQDGEPISKKMRGNNNKVRTPLHTLKGHKESISSLVWMSNDTVLSASMDHTVKLWDAELCGIKTEIVGNKSFFYADYSMINQLVLTASADRHIRLYDPRSQEGSLVKTNFTSHTKWVQSVRWSKTDEFLFISGGMDNQVKLWDTRSPKAPLYELSGHDKQVLCCDWSNPKYMVSGGADNTVHIFKSKKAPTIN